MNVCRIRQVASALSPATIGPNSEHALPIHVDPLGGWSGDMFIAAMLDAMPQHWPAVRATVERLDLGPEAACRLVEHRDAALTGLRFIVAAETAAAGTLRPAPGHDHHEHHDGHHRQDHDQPGRHTHRSWASIRHLIEAAGLDAAVTAHALAIFGLLAEAEAQVHGVAADDVTFHEVGAVDSIVDILAAAQILALVGPQDWSASPLPLGSGRVKTAHGILPVPAPATALLLRGLPVLDDGIPGERVTPTGAAIARHLLLPARERAGLRPRRILGTGTGFGTRTLPGIANCLRVIVFDDDEAQAQGAFHHRELGVITFEVDDQSAEDLAAGLDHVRALEGVHDVVQGVAFGKKGRVAVQVQVLVAPNRLDQAIAACFEETTTIGLRYHLVKGAALMRDADTVEAEGRALRVKTVKRPGDRDTAKTEVSDVAAERGHANRARLRGIAESSALDRLAAARARFPTGSSQ